MSKQSKREYQVYYGVDSNAALQPQYAPKPQKKPQTETKRTVSKAREVKALRRAQVLQCVSLSLLVVCVAALGFLVVTRNAEIYSNNRHIRELAKEKTELQVLMNKVEQESAVGGELNSYFDIAENHLELAYPAEDNIVRVVVPAVNGEVTDDVQESVDVYDAVLDWFSSIGRGFKIWA
jgi:hypothetical protein